MITPQDQITKSRRAKFSMPFDIFAQLSNEREPTETEKIFHKRYQSFRGRINFSSSFLPDVEKDSYTKSRTIIDQLDELQPFERSRFEHIKSKWNEGREQRSLSDSRWVEAPITSRWVDESGFSDEMILRFARCNYFDATAALNAMNKMDLRFLTLTCEKLENQLQKKVCDTEFLFGRYDFKYVVICFLHFYVFILFLGIIHTTWTEKS